MEQFDANEFSGVTFDSEFESFLGLSASSECPSSQQSFGQSGVRSSQCPGCAKYKSDLDRLDYEHRVNFRFLKKKVISTDLLIRKFKAKQEAQCDAQGTEIQDLNLKLDRMTRDADILSQQLKKAMEDVKPLQEEKERLEGELRSSLFQIRELNDQIDGDRALMCQRTARDDHNRNLEVEVTKLKRHNTTLTTRVRGLDARLKELLCEKKGLGSSKSVAERRLENMALALHEAQDICNLYWAKLMSYGLTAGEKKPNIIPNGQKALVRKCVSKKNGADAGETNGTTNTAVSDEDTSGNNPSDDDSDFDNVDNNISDVDLEDGDGATTSSIISENLPSSSKPVENEIDTPVPVSELLKKSSEIVSTISQNSKAGVISQADSWSSRKQMENGMRTNMPVNEIDVSKKFLCETTPQSSLLASASQNSTPESTSLNRPAEITVKTSTAESTSKNHTAKSTFLNCTPENTVRNSVAESTSQSGSTRQSLHRSPKKQTETKAPSPAAKTPSSANSQADTHKSFRPKVAAASQNSYPRKQTGNEFQTVPARDLKGHQKSTEMVSRISGPKNRGTTGVNEKVENGKNTNADGVKIATKKQKCDAVKVNSSEVGSSDESSLSSLSSMSSSSSSEDDSDDDNRDLCIQKKSFNFDEVFSLAYIQDMLSPLPESPNPSLSAMSPVDELEDASDPVNNSCTTTSQESAAHEYQVHAGGGCTGSLTPSSEKETLLKSVWSRFPEISNALCSLSSDSEIDDDGDRPGTPDFSSDATYATSSTVGSTKNIPEFVEKHSDSVEPTNETTISGTKAQTIIGSGYETVLLHLPAQTTPVSVLEVHSSESTIGKTTSTTLNGNIIGHTNLIAAETHSSCHGRDCKKSVLDSESEELSCAEAGSSKNLPESITQDRASKRTRSQAGSLGFITEAEDAITTPEGLWTGTCGPDSILSSKTPEDLRVSENIFSISSSSITSHGQSSSMDVLEVHNIAKVQISLAALIEASNSSITQKPPTTLLNVKIPPGISSKVLNLSNVQTPSETLSKIPNHSDVETLSETLSEIPDPSDIQLPSQTSYHVDTPRGISCVQSPIDVLPTAQIHLENVCQNQPLSWTSPPNQSPSKAHTQMPTEDFSHTQTSLKNLFHAHILSERTQSEAPSLTLSHVQVPSVTSSITQVLSVTPSFVQFSSITPSITPSIVRVPSVSPSITQAPSITPIIQLPSVTPSIIHIPSVTSPITQAPSIIQVSTVTPSITQLPLVTSSITQAPSITQLPSVTPSIMQLSLVTPSITQLPSVTTSITQTPLVTPPITLVTSATSSITQAPSVTPSNTQVPLVTLSVTQVSSITSSIAHKPSVASSISKVPPVTPSHSVVSSNVSETSLLSLSNNKALSSTEAPSNVPSKTSLRPSKTSLSAPLNTPSMTPPKTSSLAPSKTDASSNAAFKTSSKPSSLDSSYGEAPLDAPSKTEAFSSNATFKTSSLTSSFAQSTMKIEQHVLNSSKTLFCVQNNLSSFPHSQDGSGSTPYVQTSSELSDEANDYCEHPIHNETILGDLSDLSSNSSDDDGGGGSVKTLQVQVDGGDLVTLDTSSAECRNSSMEHSKRNREYSKRSAARNETILGDLSDLSSTSSDDDGVGGSVKTLQVRVEGGLVKSSAQCRNSSMEHSKRNRECSKRSKARNNSSIDGSRSTIQNCNIKTERNKDQTKCSRKSVRNITSHRVTQDMDVSDKELPENNSGLSRMALRKQTSLTNKSERNLVTNSDSIKCRLNNRMKNMRQTVVHRSEDTAAQNRSRCLDMDSVASVNKPGIELPSTEYSEQLVLKVDSKMETKEKHVSDSDLSVAKLSESDSSLSSLSLKLQTRASLERKVEDGLKRNDKSVKSDLNTRVRKVRQRTVLSSEDEAPQRKYQRRTRNVDKNCDVRVKENIPVKSKIWKPISSDSLNGELSNMKASPRTRKVSNNSSGDVSPARTEKLTCDNHEGVRASPRTRKVSNNSSGDVSPARTGKLTWDSYEGVRASSRTRKVSNNSSGDVSPARTGKLTCDSYEGARTSPRTRKVSNNSSGDVSPARTEKLTCDNHEGVRASPRTRKVCNNSSGDVSPARTGKLTCDSYEGVRASPRTRRVSINSSGDVSPARTGKITCDSYDGVRASPRTRKVSNNSSGDVSPARTEKLTCDNHEGVRASPRTRKVSNNSSGDVSPARTGKLTWDSYEGVRASSRTRKVSNNSSGDVSPARTGKLTCDSYEGARTSPRTRKVSNNSSGDVSPARTEKLTCDNHEGVRASPRTRKVCNNSSGDVSPARTGKLTCDSYEGVRASPRTRRVSINSSGDVSPARTGKITCDSYDGVRASPRTRKVSNNSSGDVSPAKTGKLACDSHKGELSNMRNSPYTRKVSKDSSNDVSPVKLPGLIEVRRTRRSSRLSESSTSSQTEYVDKAEGCKLKSCSPLEQNETEASATPELRNIRQNHRVSNLINIKCENDRSKNSDLVHFKPSSSSMVQHMRRSSRLSESNVPSMGVRINIKNTEGLVAASAATKLSGTQRQVEGPDMSKIEKKFESVSEKRKGRVYIPVINFVKASVSDRQVLVHENREDCVHISENETYLTRISENEDLTCKSENKKELTRISVEKDLSHRSDNEKNLVHRSGNMNELIHRSNSVKDFVHLSGNNKDLTQRSDTVKDYVHRPENIKDFVDSSEEKDLVTSFKNVKDFVDSSVKGDLKGISDNAKDFVVSCYKHDSGQSSKNKRDCVDTLEDLKPSVHAQKTMESCAYTSEKVVNDSVYEKCQGSVLALKNTIHMSEDVTDFCQNSLAASSDDICVTDVAKNACNVSEITKNSVNVSKITKNSVNVSKITKNSAHISGIQEEPVHSSQKTNESVRIIEKIDSIHTHENVRQVENNSRGITVEHASTIITNKSQTSKKGTSTSGKNINRKGNSFSSKNINEKSQEQQVCVNKNVQKNSKTVGIKSVQALFKTDTPSLSDIFKFFKLPPRLLLPLPPSPPPSSSSNDSPFARFQSTAPMNVLKVAPQTRSEMGTAGRRTGSLTSQMMEARKMLAKRQTAVPTKLVPQTNGRGRKRVADRAELSPAGSCKKKKLANLSGFPSAVAAVMYDLRQYLTASKVTINATVETILSRLEEENVKAAWDLLCPVVLKHLDSRQEDVFVHLLSACQEKAVLDTVFMREDESRLVQLVSAFWSLEKELDRHTLMGLIWTAIFSRDCTNQLVRLSHCRVFVGLCMELGDLEQARILVYSIAWCDNLDLVNPLMAIVGVWPAVLNPTYNVSEEPSSSVTMVLKFMLRNKCKEDDSLFQKVCLVMQRICQIDLKKEDDPPEKLLKNLLQQLLHRVQNVVNGCRNDNSFEAVKAVELLLVHQGLAWTEDHFVRRNFMSFAMKWENKSPEKGGLPDQFITCLIQIFRAVLEVQSLSSSAVATVLGAVFPRFIKGTANNSTMELASVDAVLELAPLNPEKCLDILKKWQARKKGTIPPQTLSKLEQVRKILVRDCSKKKRK